MVVTFCTANIIYFLAADEIVIKAELNEYPSRKLSPKFFQILLRSKYFHAFFCCAHIFFPTTLSMSVYYDHLTYSTNTPPQTVRHIVKIQAY